MNGNRRNRYVILTAVAIFAASLVTGLAPFAIMLIAGAAGIEAGIPGAVRTGYSLGPHKVTGFPTRLLGMTAIAFGMGIIAFAAWSFFRLSSA
jgi:hypothetical protein